MEREELLGLLKSDVGAFNRFRTENPNAPVDLQGADLRGASLPKAELRRANLQQADLRDATLSEAALVGADLRGAKLQGANLRGALLHNANMRGANLSGARIGPFTDDARMCVNACCFENVRYDRQQLEQILAVLNLNSAWTIRYELVPKSPDRDKGAGASG